MILCILYTCTCTLKATIVARECEQIVDKVHFHCKRKTWIVIIECCECHIVVCNLCRSWSLEMICEKSSFTVNLYVDVHIFMSIIVTYMCIPVVHVLGWLLYMYYTVCGWNRLLQYRYLLNMFDVGALHFLNNWSDSYIFWICALYPKPRKGCSLNDFSL